MGEIRQAMNLAIGQLHMQAATASNQQYQADKKIADAILAELPLRIQAAAKMNFSYVELYADCKYIGERAIPGSLTGVGKILVSTLMLHEDCTIEDFRLQPDDSDPTAVRLVLFVCF